MDVIADTIFYNKKIRFCIIWGLVFSFIFPGCSETQKEDQRVNIQWNGSRAESISIPRELLTGIPKDSIGQLLHIQLENINTPMLGEYILADDSVIFRPLINFTRGLKYEIRLAAKLLTTIEIPIDNLADAPKVIAIYPTRDTVPQNLLKIYIAFSKPMQEGQASKNIIVIKNRQDTIPSIFLDLEQELWNKERTMLTLWLDPGRIKRELQPNRKLGSPLQHNNTYQVSIKQGWKDVEGVLLARDWQKNFIVGLRDIISPDPELWTIDVPKAGSNGALKINLNEPLDYLLLKNTVRMIDNTGNILDGVIETEEGEMVLIFTPSVAWSPGRYTLEIESRLEDLAGNNLNRLFDKDITGKNTTVQKQIHTRVFHIQ